MRQLPPVDDDVFEALQARAEPLVDDVNSVLRRLLGLDGRAALGPTPGAVAARPSKVTPGSVESSKRAPQKIARSKTKSATSRSGKGTRAPRGSLLPEAEYELPLLKALDSRGGAAPASELIEAVGLDLDHRLTDVDREVLDSGLTRWKNRVQFVRLKLVQAGLMTKDSPRGVWELTPAGKARLKAMAKDG